MNKTAIIYSLDEALAMEPSKRPMRPKPPRRSFRAWLLDTFWNL